jgi:hypothetical protein
MAVAISGAQLLNTLTQSAGFRLVPVFICSAFAAVAVSQSIICFCCTVTPPLYVVI